ncbi:hypothetical protein, partial [Methylicorpusculum sp.]|uniref:hypothetical protein n=1 Tax=Methylicorpusculum sp. TaxID=2713644 RepID=UPI002ABB6569
LDQCGNQYQNRNVCHARPRSFTDTVLQHPVQFCVNIFVKYVHAIFTRHTRTISTKESTEKENIHADAKTVNQISQLV